MNMVAFALPMVCLALLAYVDGVVLPRRKARRAREAAEKRRMADEGTAIDGQRTAAR